MRYLTSVLAALALVCSLLALTGCPAVGETVALSALRLDQASQGWGAPQQNKSVDGAPLTVAGKRFAHGFGTHAESLLFVDLKGGATKLTGFAGVDDETEKRGSVVFELIADGRTVWESGILRGGEPAKQFDLDLTGVKLLLLHVADAGDGMNYDHADWAEVQITYAGAAPQTRAAPHEEPVILTPAPGPQPRLTGPKVFGVRPGHPFLFKVTATGRKPLTFAAAGLPAGLALDAKTGLITGEVARAGTYRPTLSATNSAGKASRELRIEVGEALALTPPLGWNSWNCWAGAVDADKVLRCARAMVSSGLSDHGFSYVNIDDTWQAKRGGQYNALQGNAKFPDLKGLCDQIHALGLRAGIYSTPWVKSYAGYPGGASNAADGSYDPNASGHGAYGFEEADAKQYAAWGFDYLKYDWNPNDVPHVAKMAEALRASGRDIVYSLSNSAPYEQASEWLRLAQCWRTTGDINDTWGSMSGLGFAQDPWGPFGGPGHWNDPDMLVVGHVGWGPNLHPTRLTPNEQYTHISLWCLLSAPLLLGCDLERLDAFTLSLLTNDEVLEVNQDPLGRQARRVCVRGRTEVWCRPLEDGGRAVGLFNRGEQEAPVTVEFDDCWVRGPQAVRDLWRQKDLGRHDHAFTTTVPRHGVVLVKLAGAK